MENPFGTNIHLAQVIAPAEAPAVQRVEKGVAGKKSKGKGVESEPTELKVTDKVKIYTGVVPDLENGKDKLKEILEQDYDVKVRQALEGFVEQLETMQVAMLDFAKVAIQSRKVEESLAQGGLPAVPTEGAEIQPSTSTVKITAQMING